MGKKKPAKEAPWWWVPAACELWADRGKPNQQAAFFQEVVKLVEAASGGAGNAAVTTRTNWGNASAWPLEARPG